MTTAALPNITPAKAQNLLTQNNAILVDIRQGDEFAREHIAHAVNISAERVKEAEDADKIAIFYCQSGQRTQLAAPSLRDLSFKEAYILEGGLNAWKKSGLDVAFNPKAPISIMRQVQIIAGSLVLLGVLLAFLLHPHFIGISAFVGAGLLFAGISGFCGMAVLLAKMPWNRQAIHKS